MSPDSVVSATGRPLRGDAQRRPAADAARRAFLDQGVPLAAGLAVAGPAGVDGAATLADEPGLQLHHRCSARTTNGDGLGPPARPPAARLERAPAGRARRVRSRRGLCACACAGPAPMPQAEPASNQGVPCSAGPAAAAPRWAGTGRAASSGRRTGSSTSPSVFSPDHERRRPGAAGSPARRPAGARARRPRLARAPPGASAPAPARRRCRRPSLLRQGVSCFAGLAACLRSRGRRRRSSGRRTSPSPSVLSRSSSSQQRVVVGPALLGCAAGRFRQAGFCPHCRPAPDRYRWPGPPVRPGRSASCGSGSGQFDGDELGDAAGHTARTALFAARRWRRTGACGHVSKSRSVRPGTMGRPPAALVIALGQVAILREVGEPREFALELKPTVPVGPCLCLAMITSALPRSFMSLSHCRYSGEPGFGSRFFK